MAPSKLTWVEPNRWTSLAASGWPTISFRHAGPVAIYVTITDLRVTSASLAPFVQPRLRPALGYWYDGWAPGLLGVWEFDVPELYGAATVKDETRAAIAAHEPAPYFTLAEMCAAVAKEVKGQLAELLTSLKPPSPADPAAPVRYWAYPAILQTWNLRRDALVRGDRCTKGIHLPLGAHDLVVATRGDGSRFDMKLLYQMSAVRGQGVGSIRWASRRLTGFDPGVIHRTCCQLEYKGPDT